MAKLAYKTRGDSPLQGKRKVYFCCHPKDFKGYFKPICEDVFKTQNCIICYNEHPEKPWDEEDMVSQFAEINLLVIPVTSRFLYQPNEAREKEFAYAIQKGIPVLPLIQEEGLEEDFNKICGGLQCLNKRAIEKDPTATPYDEKLERYLKAVLLGDELVAKVRAAFDAYVFLSYRKIDRAYAQKLIRLIHDNDFCRDIGIWYDEALVPGEKFDPAILEALTKCEMFALAVTPNLLEPGNYVMENEYKEARKQDKPIIPAEMVPTDRAALHQYYENIPEPFNADDKPALSQAMLEQLQALAIEENDEDPSHLFFIGLAYLNGIDVELDRPKGIKLIERAANKNLPEAMEKMSQIYQYGEGVQRNYETAAQWLEKLADYWEQCFANKDTEENGTHFLSALQNAGSAWESMEQFAPAQNYYKKMLDIAEQLVNRFGGDFHQRNLAISYSKMGDICKNEGRIAKAKEWYKNALTIHEQMALETEILVDFHYLTITYGRMGNIYRDEGNITEAKEWYMKALLWSSRLAQKTGRIEHRRLLASSYEGFGDMCESENNLAEAKHWYMESLSIREQLVQETEMATDRHSLSASYNHLGDICKKTGSIAEAKDWYERAWIIREQLVQETNAIEHRKILSISYDNLGNIYSDAGNITESKKYYKKSLAIREQLVQEADTKENRFGLAISYEKLGNICKEEHNIIEAKEQYEMALTILEQLVKETEIVEIRRILAIVHIDFGDICHVEENNTKAKMHYRESTAIFEQLILETNQEEICQGLASSYNRMSAICKVEGNFAEAKDWGKKLIAIYDQPDQETDVGHLQNLAFNYENLASICMAEKNLPEAKSWYKKYSVVNEQWARETGKVEDRQRLASGYEKLADICKAEGNFAEAKEWYEKELPIYERIAHETKTADSYDDVAIVYYLLGILDPHALDTACLEQAESIYASLVKQYPDEKKYTSNLSGIRSTLASCYDHLGDRCKNASDAKNWYAKAVLFYEQLNQEEETIWSRRNMAINYEKIGNICEIEGDFAEARSWYEQAMNVFSHLMIEAGSLTLSSMIFFDGLAVAYYKLGKLDPNGPDLFFLKQAETLWDVLVKQYPKAGYQQRLTTVRKEIQQLQQ